ncbi:MAG TPA: S-layer homology domain-containing protein [Anaerolineales bacterium]|nr:S-layer homology domain-containing protein [Anaerolineales bacterium]
MSKKFFTVLLLAVFMLAQFSVASAATVAGDASITNIPDFANLTDVDVDWSVTGMAAGPKYILIWSRIQADPPVALYTGCMDIATINGSSDASGTFTYDLTLIGPNNGDVVEFIVTVDSTACAGVPDIPVDTDAPMGDTTIDSFAPEYFNANPPSITGLPKTIDPVACNTFEYWAMATDHYMFPSTIGYSGIGAWNLQVTGTFAPPAPVGPGEDLLSWKFTFPSTASGAWTVSHQVEDQAGNQNGAPAYFRNALVIAPAELEDCTTFSDVSGHEYEVYIRYLATLGLVSGFDDGTFGPDTTLTRAEAATLFEISNGYDATLLPTTAPAGCDFTDVVASDWFAGWVWQACSDGFMSGIGDGRFDPNNLLTRGQIVTIFNNVANVISSNPGVIGGYMDTDNTLAIAYPTALVLRTAAWMDVPIGAYYAEPVQLAYGWGVADGTSDTTFSPDQPATRGEYIKMLYRALSIVN